MLKIKQDIQNFHLEHKNEQVTAGAMEMLAQWTGDLHAYAGTIQGIRRNEHLSAKGKEAAVDEERQKMLKRLVNGELIQDKLVDGVVKLQKSIASKLEDATKSRANDAAYRLIEAMRETEIRALLPQWQARAEQERLAAIDLMRKNKLAVPDDLLQPRNVTKDFLIETAKNFLSDDPVTQANNRTAVRAILESPVPILNSADLAEGKAVLTTSVAGDLVAAEKAARDTLDVNNIVFSGLERLIRNPLLIGTEHKPHAPISDQERKAA